MATKLWGPIHCWSPNLKVVGTSLPRSLRLLHLCFELSPIQHLIFIELVCQQYVGEVGKSITDMLQINSVHRLPNIMGIGKHLNKGGVF